MTATRAVWSDGKTTVEGEWEYYRPGDFFIIRLDDKDPITQQPRKFKTHFDVPEWGKFKRISK